MAEEKKTSKQAEKAEKSKDTKKKSKKNPFKSIASFFKSEIGRASCRERV